jgi:hypothetical protein
LSFAPDPDAVTQTANGTGPPLSAADQDPRYSVSLSWATATHADLATWLLAKEIDVQAQTAGRSAAAERVCQKLTRRLSRLVSPAGSQAILSRALHLVRAEFPFLQRVRARGASEAGLEGLDELIHDVDEVEAARALLAVLSRLLDLLVEFLGEDFVVRLVREVWPDLPLREPGRPGKPDGQEAPS